MSVDEAADITISIIEGSPAAAGWVASAGTALPRVLHDVRTPRLRVVSGPCAGRVATARLFVDGERATFTGLTAFDALPHTIDWRDPAHALGDAVDAVDR